MMLLDRSLLLAAALGALLVQARPGLAQYVHPLRDSGLTPADIDMAMDAAERLYSNPTALVGDRAEWRNPDTGTFGAVRIEGSDSVTPCLLLAHTLNGPRTGERNFTIRRCKDGTGSWVVTP